MSLRNKTILSAGIMAAIIGVEVQAASVESQLFVGRVNQLSDNSAEHLLKNTGNFTTNVTNDDSAVVIEVQTTTLTSAPGTTYVNALNNTDANVPQDFTDATEWQTNPAAPNSRIQVGDRIRAMYTIETVEAGAGNTNSLGGASGNNELTALGDLLVVQKVISYIDTNNNDVYDQGTDFATDGKIFFAPYPGFAAELQNLDANKDHANRPVGDFAGTLFELFEDPANNYTREGTIAATEATASDGVLMAALGFGLDPDELMFSDLQIDNGVLRDDVLDVRQAATASNFGTTNVQISILFEDFPTVDFKQVRAGFATGAGGADGMIDMNGSGNTLGTGEVNTEHHVYDNFDLAVFVVPEPGTVGLLGLGLLGAAGIARRRRQVRD